MRYWIACLLVFLAGCEQSATPVKPAFDRTNTPIELTVVFHGDLAALQQEYRRTHPNSPHSKVNGLTGFATWNEVKNPGPFPNATLLGNSPATCVVHTTRPRKVDDKSTLVLGHELLHCINGSYHP